MTAAAHVERLLAASPERVWRALTTEQLADWFWPARFATAVTIDARPGGDYRIDGTAVGMAASGSFVSVEAPRLLVQTWRWDGENLETRVEMRLDGSPDGSSTRLTITQSGFAEQQGATEHEQGWNDCLDRLDRLLADA